MWAPLTSKAAFLSAGWINSDISILLLAGYIKRIEAKIGADHTGWEHTWEQKRSHVFGDFSIGGTFIGIPLFSLWIGAISLTKFDATSISFLVVSAISLIYSIASLFWYFSKRHGHQSKNDNTVGKISKVPVAQNMIKTES